MDEERAFLEEIQESPECDEPRTVFADWLEDRGDPRADFIRLQCSAPVSPHRRDHERRERDLLDAHRPAWLAPVRAALGADLAGRIQDYQFLRGFVAEVSLSAADFVERAPRLFEAIPLLESVCLTEVRSAVARLAGCPWLGRLKQLRMASLGLGNFGVQALAESRHLTRLSTLRLHRNGIGSPGVEALVRSDRLPELRVLDLSGNVLGDGGLQALAVWSRLEQLTELDLAHNRITDDEACGFLDRLSRHPTRLTRLSLGSNQLQGEAAHALRRAAGSLPLLFGLDLSGNSLGTDGAEALSATQLLNVRDLDLASSQLDVTAVRLLIRAFPQLDRLSLADNPGLGDAGLLALLELGLPRDSLDLSGTSIGDGSLVQLAASPALENLHVLGLRHTLAGPTGVRALLDSPHSQRLVSLSLSGVNFGAEGIAALAASPRLAGLRELHVGGSNVGPVGARRLADSPALTGLRVLDLASAAIGDSGARSLAGAASLTGLRDLNLSRCRIGDAGAESLAGSSKLAGLVRLDLSGNELGDAGVRSLAWSPHLAHLAELNLLDNPCTDAAAEALAASPFLTHLTRLQISTGALSTRLQQTLRRRFGS